MDIIRLKNMVFYGYHGVHESEKALGGKFEVDLEIYRDLRQAGKTDDLNDTLNYENVYKTVYNCIKKNKFYLIEALAERIAQSIIKKYKTERVSLRVRKPHAPIKGVLDTVEVEIDRSQSDYE